jgi:ABC-type multidrug transport system ATPase subunit
MCEMVLFGFPRVVSLQLDNHFPTLTVRETLEFAKKCQRGIGEGSIVKTVKLLLESRRKRNMAAAKVRQT